jgi:hypothetical protein
MTNAVLFRDVPLVVRDVSSGGCSIESCTLLQIGTVGWLEVEFEGDRRFEWFRIARVQKREDGVFLAGLEFLPLAAAGSDSLRSAIGRLRRSTTADVSPDAAGRSSGDSGNSDADSAGQAAESASRTTNSARKLVDFLRRR